MVTKEHEVKELSERLGSTSDFMVLAKPKLRISRAITDAMKEEEVSMRQLAESVGNMKHPQIHRITSGKNYNIDSLLKIMNELGLELLVRKKQG